MIYISLVSRHIYFEVRKEPRVRLEELAFTT